MNYLKVFLLLILLPFIVINPILILYALIAFILRIVISNLYKIPSSFSKCLNIYENTILNIILISLFLSSLIIAFIQYQKNYLIDNGAGYAEPFIYKMHLEFSKIDMKWEIEDELKFVDSDQKYLTSRKLDISNPRWTKKTNKIPLIKEIKFNNNHNILFNPIFKANEPKLFEHLGDYFLEAYDINIHAPKNAILSSYPPIESRSDFKENNTEVILLKNNHDLMLRKNPYVKLEVVHPHLRNELMFTIFKFSVSYLIKGLIFGLALIFFSQIRKEILDPIANVIVRKLRINRTK